MQRENPAVSLYRPNTRSTGVAQVQVSIRRIQFEQAWAKVQEMQTTDAVFEGPIVAVNRGGAIVMVEVRLPPEIL